ncbi:aconitate hydratase AcnA [Paenibacillus woosongensis]|uniref:Aconitate hydratase n=1 Tax=Paenibacillus woosongensis TaxID=307580 RepID=A0A7X2Z2Z7_9BACL|nr:aconitate hydratase AcnA [Paenibacillus woosongensis]MUG46552.1 aconitate hydratase AcnA [Paenibacillus woosongensis]
MSTKDFFSVSRTLEAGGKKYRYFDLQLLEEKGLGPVSKLPFSIKVLLEAAVRQFDGRAITEEHVKQIAGWSQGRDENKEIPFIPARIVLQDFTGVPVVVDLAAMRDTVKKAGGDPKQINPLVPVDLVIDHSVMVDAFGTPEALEYNMKVEFERNEERYRFLRWAQTAFNNFRAVPPATGIVHQVNLEYLASVAATKTIDGETVVFPDSLVGTDSHTTMINGLGVVGWGVGGIEAEAGMLGQPLYFVAPEVIGFKLVGSLTEGATATDLALTVTQMLRKKGVVGKFVEFYGPGLANISLADRATVANMAPEYGATIGYFPVDDETLAYLRSTGRSEEQIALVEAYYKAQGMFRTSSTADPEFTDLIELDLASVVPSLAGPKRPQDRIELTDMKENFNDIIRTPIDKGGYGLSDEKINQKVTIKHPDGSTSELGTGAVVIAAITSCTNTSNPSVMIGAGLLAKKAVERGLTKPGYVKSSLTPGSLVVSEYLEKAGLMESFEALGFHVAGYGCATCIGNSGPLPDEVSAAIADNDLTVAAVLSGNRNFEGRVHAQVKANYLASPPLVVAYALAGTVNIDLQNDPIGYDQNDQPVYLKDIWPTSAEIKEAIGLSVKPEMFRSKYENVFTQNERWNAIPVPEGELYEWDEKSTYIQNPPFFEKIGEGLQDIADVRGARVLALLGDSVTTDHISPAGNISPTSPAGIYLNDHGVARKDFNSYGSRRGNHEVMMRGTFANIRIRNQVAPGTEGGVTKYLPTDELMSIYDASMNYQANGQNLVVIAGKEYGTGSSRDWAAKGTYLLGVKAVIAESFERIHRSNLVGMGVLPLQFQEGHGWKTLGIDGTETFDILGLSNDVKPGQELTVVATRQDGTQFEFTVIARLDSMVDVDYYHNGGILQTVLRQMIQAGK